MEKNKTILSEGKKAPSFTLSNQNNEEISLIDKKGKWVILYFYPRDNTPGCTIEAIDFSELKEEFEKNNAIIFGVSPDSTQSHCKFIQGKGLKIALLSDESKEILSKYGVWGEKKFMGKTFMGVIRGTFLIDSKGIIRKIWSPVKVKNHAKEVLENLKSLSKNK